MGSLPSLLGGIVPVSSPYPASAGGEGVRIEWHEGAIATLLESPTGEVGKWLERAGERVADRARTLAPRDTGQLADSIDSGVEMGSQGLEARIGPAEDRNARAEGRRANEDVCRFVELGTSRRRARPFLRPALDAARG